jgi:hypothetical protein
MKWFWILGVLLGGRKGRCGAQLDSGAIPLEKIKTADGKIPYAWKYAGRKSIF